MAIGAILAVVAAPLGLAMMVPPLARQGQHWLNERWRNEILGVAEAVQLHKRGAMTDAEFLAEMNKHGIDDEHRDWMSWLAVPLHSIAELIALYRRRKLDMPPLSSDVLGLIKAQFPEADQSLIALYGYASMSGWQPGQVDRMLLATEVIPSAGDIIRYAVREIYHPEIAEAFGQFEGLDEVMKLAAPDITAAGLPYDTFRKEWGAHWMLPSIMQGFEMLHRGIIPAKETAADPLSLTRLMTALDVMPAWRERLTAISYSPYTRVDVRRMHKIGVLDDKAVFTAYADVGFSPFAPGETHDTVDAAFECETCRHGSKAGRMLDFTLIYNADPEDERKEKERDLTKADILAGLRDRLLEDGEANSALSTLGYDSDEVAYYTKRVDFERAKGELSDTLRYAHDAYVRGIIDHNEVAAQLGTLALPAQMTDYYLKVWAQERASRINKPTKSELLTFLRKEIIDKDTWHTEMLGLGYPDKYIEWYARTI